MTSVFDGKEGKIAMTSEFELSEQLQSRPTRRVVVATGAKLAYTVPIVAASLKVSGLNAAAISGGGICAHSSGTNGGCLPTCTARAVATGCPNPGNQCNDICGNGQATGACPVGSGGGNPCCDPAFCEPGNYTCVAGKVVSAATCTVATASSKKKKR